MICNLNILNASIKKRIDNGEEVSLCAKFRYRQKDVSVSVKKFDEKYLEVKYPSKVKSVTPGQECALYDKDELVGGGTIDLVYMDEEKRRY